MCPTRAQKKLPMNNYKQDKMIQVSLPLLHVQESSENRRMALTTISPTHFSIFQLNKLEEVFSYQKWPDKTRVDVIAMECNLLKEDVEDWFLARRVEWMRIIMELTVKNKKQESNK